MQPREDAVPEGVPGADGVDDTRRGTLSPVAIVELVDQRLTADDDQRIALVINEEREAA